MMRFWRSRKIGCCEPRASIWSAALQRRFDVGLVQSKAPINRRTPNASSVVGDFRHRSDLAILQVSSAFTLIEVVISAALMALIVVSAYLCLHAGLSSQKLVEPRADIIQNARVALALMTADLRDACPLSKDFEFLGMHRMLGDAEADNLDFATHHYTPRHAREGDFCEVSYFADKDPETGRLSLWRRRNPTLALDPLSGGSREEIAKNILGIRLEYFDGLDWYQTWGDVSGRGKAQSSQRDRDNLSSMPEAVRITLWLDSNPKSTSAPGEERTIEPPLVFQTVARLELAAKEQGSASSASSGNSESGASAQTGGSY